MRLVRSSEIGAVARDQAVRLLTERATLTRMVCRELLDSADPALDRRPQTALYFLLQWIDANQREYVRIEPRAGDGLDHMIVPEGYADLVPEIEAGVQVCDALFMLFTADTGLQAAHDRAKIKDRLAAYWQGYPKPVPVERRIG